MAVNAGPDTAGERGAGKRKGTGRGHAYGRLREDILALRMRPGARIDEAALVRELRISRTPVREALIRLAGEGLVELLPNRGARVSDIPVVSLPEFFEALSLVQRAIHRWAALRRTQADLARIEAEHRRFARVARARPEAIPVANRAFHAAIAQAARNPFLAQCYGELLDQGLRLSRFTVVYDPPRGSTRKRHFEAVVADHDALLRAIRRRDADAAERRAGEHAALFRRRVLDFLAAGDEASALAVDPPAQEARAAKRAARKAGTRSGASLSSGATCSSR